MRFLDIIKMSFINVIRSKTKTSLTVLSIAIGIAAVYIILSLSVTGEEVVAKEISKLGIDGLSVYSQSASIDNGKIKLKTGDILKNKFNFVEEVMPLVTLYGNFNIKSAEDTAVYLGVDKMMGEVLGIHLLHGRLFNAQDIKFEKKVAVVDNQFAKSIYKRENIVGKKLNIGINSNIGSFEIVGVIESQKSAIDGLLGGKIPEIIYIPYTTANFMNHSDGADQIAIKCNDTIGTNEAAQTIQRALNKDKKIVYKVENINGYITQIKTITSFITLILSVIAGISLFVAGIGVMNMMLSTIIERRREIGIWIALGAKRSDIFILLLSEAITLCLIGGISGGGFGLLVVQIIKHILNIGYNSDFLLFAIPLLFSLILGITFGTVPSIKASKMCPVELLRDE